MSALRVEKNMPLMAGEKLGSYEILSPLGAGGMGEVYRARDTKLGREVAIKVLPEEFTEHPQKLARFEREARLLASLNHPNIATLYGVEEVESPQPERSAERSGVAEREAVGVGPRGPERSQPFLVMELVEGETLAERIARGRLPGNTVDLVANRKHAGTTRAVLGEARGRRSSTRLGSERMGSAFSRREDVGLRGADVRTEFSALHPAPRQPGSHTAQRHRRRYRPFLFARRTVARVFRLWCPEEGCGQWWSGANHCADAGRPRRHLGTRRYDRLYPDQYDRALSRSPLPAGPRSSSRP